MSHESIFRLIEYEIYPGRHARLERLRRTWDYATRVERTRRFAVLRVVRRWVEPNRGFPDVCG